MVRIDPPIDAWADALKRSDAVVATGHQAFLWHPGILTKVLAMQAAAERFGCKALYVVVDQDVHDALTLELPRVIPGEGDRLSIDTVRFGTQRIDVPTGFQPPAKLDVSGITSDAIRTALQQAEGDTLAQQMTRALRPLVEPAAGAFDVLFVSAMWEDAGYRALVQRMIDDAEACATAYNAALRETGTRDVAPLHVTAGGIELPLWACAWEQPRRRVYVRDGEVDTDLPLLPKALTLSAVMRSLYSDLFIHGLGGEIYDRATEAWWRNWRGEDLKPMAVATADLRLNFDAPVATRDDLARAIWRRHHLRHNMAPRKKEPLLAEMEATDDRAARHTLFKQMHRLNDDALAADPAPLREAEAAVARARAGVANAALAAKRDWCVGLYPPERLRRLREAVAGRATMPA